MHNIIYKHPSESALDYLIRKKTEQLHKTLKNQRRRKNWRSGFIPLLPKQEGLVNNYLLII